MRNRNKISKDRGFLTSAAILGLGVIVFALCTALVLCTALSPVICTAISAVIFAAGAVGIIFYSALVGKRTFNAGGNVPDSILRDSVLNMDFPMVICDITTDKIIWYNKVSGVLSGKDITFPFS